MTSGNREQFIQDCDAGKYDNIVAISRTYDSVEVSIIQCRLLPSRKLTRLQITGRFDPELVSHLPKSVKFISHNGAGYDQIDVNACTERSSLRHKAISGTIY